MEIKKHQNESFGSLTVVYNPKTGRRMFVASEVGNIFGHTNMRQVVNRILGADESLIVNRVDW